MKIALITDIHHGPLSHTKKEGWNAVPELGRAIEAINAAKADLLLDLGDRISDTTRDHDIQMEREVYECLARFEGPRYHMVGNHDVGNLTFADNAEAMHQSMEHQVVDLGEQRLILWQVNTKIDRALSGEFPKAETELEWLVEALESDPRPAIIATHVPLSGHSQIGNFYFENNANLSTYPDHVKVRTAVEATGKAAIWLSGHVHRNTVSNVHNLQHITVQSFSERFTTYPEPAVAYGILEIADGQFTLEVFGRDPFFVRLPFRPSGLQKWIPAMPPFGERVSSQKWLTEGVNAFLAQATPALQAD